MIIFDQNSLKEALSKRYKDEALIVVFYKKDKLEESKVSTIRILANMMKDVMKVGVMECSK